MLQSVELQHRRRPSQVSWFVPVPRRGYRTVAKTLPRRRRESPVAFASVLAASASAASGRAGLQPRQQLGDRLAAGRRSVGIQRIGGPMSGRGRGWRRHRRLPVGWWRRRRWHRRRWRRHRRRRWRGFADAGVGVFRAFSGMPGPCPTTRLAPIGFGFADLACRLGGAGMPSPPLSRRRRRRRGFAGAGRAQRSTVAGRGVVVLPRPGAALVGPFGIPIAAGCSDRQPLSFRAHRPPARGRLLMLRRRGRSGPLGPLLLRRLGRQGCRYKRWLGLRRRLLPPV